MEILHNLWNVVSTEDENLVKYIILSLTFLEAYVTLKFFTEILSINHSKRQSATYIILLSILIIISNLLIPKEISIFLHILLTPILIKLIFKTSVIKAILAEIIPMVFMTFFESIYLKLCLNLFNISYQECSNILMYRVPFMLFIYFTLLICSKLVRILKINTTNFESLDRAHKKLLTLNLLLIVICISLQFYLVAFYNSTLPITITIISLFFLVTYSIVSIYSIIKTINLEVTKSNLEQSQLYNKSLELLYNNIRAFKHDFSNILTAFGGYIYAKDMDGLEKYYNKILDECHINNNLSTLNPEVINNSAIYNILATKYYKADELGINIDLQVFINLNELKVNIYDFTRILGILLDNAIEAAALCSNKIIKIDIRDIKPRKCQILTIENSYTNKNVDINRLSEKGYTSKTKDTQNHGIGLWQVSKIIKKHPNVLLDTGKTDELFKQELAIYYK